MLFRSGNAMLIILNLPLIGMWIKLLTVPYRYLFPAIVLFCAIGVYPTRQNDRVTGTCWHLAAIALCGNRSQTLLHFGLSAV